MLFISEDNKTEQLASDTLCGQLPGHQAYRKGLLPYHGLGSGINRALAAWPQIDFADDRDGCLFTATVHRKPVVDLQLVNITPKSSPKSSPKTEEQILALIKDNAAITTEQLGEALGITKRAVLKQIDKLKEQGRLRRIGPARGGHWEVVIRSVKFEE